MQGNKAISYCLILFILWFSGCRQNVERNTGQSSSFEVFRNSFASGFKIEKYGKLKVLTIYNPWEHAEGVVYKYVLAPSQVTIPDSLKQYEQIHTPVKRIVCLSTTHLAFLNILGESDAVCGVSAPEFVYDRGIRNKVAAGKVANVGYDQALNIETLLSIKPDFVMAYGVGSEASGQFQRLKQLGIKVVFNAEYLEQTPLGKAEWIKFVGSFFDKEDTAGKIFDKTAHDYLMMKQKVASVKEKPMVLCGMPWKGVWYVPGGKSYAANFIYDAGGDYLWKEDQGSESLPLSLEKVMELANKASVWINPGASLKKNDISLFDPRMKNIQSFQKGQIFNFTARMSPGGGNDFWESGVVHPDWVLKDLIAILHPELIPNHTFVYYSKLN